MPAHAKKAKPKASGVAWTAMQLFAPARPPLEPTQAAELTLLAAGTAQTAVTTEYGDNLLRRTIMTAQELDARGRKRNAMPMTPPPAKAANVSAGNCRQAG